MASSNVARFDRHVHTGEDQATGTRWQTAVQTILHDPRYPSHMLLPVIPR
jgi:predicted acyl esterase